MVKPDWKLVDTLEKVEPFIIMRAGDWLYLFDAGTGRLLGKPLFAPHNRRGPQDETRVSSTHG